MQLLSTTNIQKQLLIRFPTRNDSLSRNRNVLCSTRPLVDRPVGMGPIVGSSFARYIHKSKFTESIFSHMFFTVLMIYVFSEGSLAAPGLSTSLFCSLSSSQPLSGMRDAHSSSSVLNFLCSHRKDKSVHY